MKFNNMKITQIGGFIIAFALIISSLVLLTHGYESEWGWFLGLGFIAFAITLFPQDLL